MQVPGTKDTFVCVFPSMISLVSQLDVQLQLNENKKKTNKKILIKIAWQISDVCVYEGKKIENEKKKLNNNKKWHI